MATDFQARVASEVLWLEDELLRYRYFREGYEKGPPSQGRAILGGLLGKKSEKALGLGWSEAKAKHAFVNNCNGAMRKALEAVEAAAVWEQEAKGFEQKLNVIDRSPPGLVGLGLGEYYVEVIIDHKGRSRLIGPFDRRAKAEEWIKAYGWDRLTPDITEFLCDIFEAEQASP